MASWLFGNGSAVGVEQIVNAVDGNFKNSGMVVLSFIDSGVNITPTDVNKILAAYLVDKSEAYCTAVYKKETSYFLAFGVVEPKYSINQLSGNYKSHAQLFFDYIVSKEIDLESVDRTLLNLFKQKYFIDDSCSKKTNLLLKSVLSFKEISLSNSPTPGTLSVSPSPRNADGSRKQEDYSSISYQNAARKELVDVIKSGEAFIIAGSGVSSTIAKGTESEKVVTWDGLLNQLKAQVESFWQSTIPEWDKMTDPLEKAAALQDFGDRQNGHIDFRRLVFKLLSNLKSNANHMLGTHVSITEAIQALKLPIATTNYDTLLENSLDRFELDAGNATENELTNFQRFVFHIHGLLHESPDVLLFENTQPYETFLKGISKLIGHESAVNKGKKEFEKEKKSIIFIGSHDSVIDHHFNGLWASEVPNESNFIILRDSTLPLMMKKPDFAKVVKAGKIIPILYGNDYSQLTPFLWNLALDAGWQRTESFSQDLGLVKTVLKQTTKEQGVVTVETSYSSGEFVPLNVVYAPKTTASLSKFW